jgi:predicted RNase H-like HicB family nuclease
MKARLSRHRKIAIGCGEISSLCGQPAAYRARMESDRFRISIHRAHGCYFASVANLPGCFARGRTQVEALENARVCIRGYLWVAQALATQPANVSLEIAV